MGSERLTEGGERRVIAARLLEGASEIEQHLRIMGVRGERRMQARDRLVVAFQLEQRVAAVVERVGMVRLDLQDPIVGCERLIMPLERLEPVSSIRTPLDL